MHLSRNESYHYAFSVLWRHDTTSNSAHALTKQQFSPSLKLWSRIVCEKESNLNERVDYEIW
jgi:hypothetical protein